MVYDDMFKKNRLLDCLGRLIVVNVCITRTRKPTLTDNYWEIRSKLQRAAVIGEFQDVQLVLLGHYRSAALISATWNNIKHVNSVNSIPRIFTPQKPEHPCLSRFLYVLAVGPLPPRRAGEVVVFSPAHKAEMAAACWNRRPYQVKSTESDRTVATPKRNLELEFLRFFYEVFMEISLELRWKKGTQQEYNGNTIGKYGCNWKYLELVG